MSAQKSWIILTPDFMAKEFAYRWWKTHGEFVHVTFSVTDGKFPVAYARVSPEGAEKTVAVTMRPKTFFNFSKPRQNSTAVDRYQEWARKAVATLAAQP